MVSVETVREVFGLECVVVPDPVCGSPLVVSAGSRGAALRDAMPAAASPPVT